MDLQLAFEAGKWGAVFKTEPLICGIWGDLQVASVRIEVIVGHPAGD